MDTKKVISQLMASKTNNVVKDLVVRNINVTECETYNSVAITLDKPVKAMVAQEDGSYVEGESNIIFVGNYSIVGALRENEDVAFAGNQLIQHPKALNVVLSGAKINIIQEAVTAGQEYTIHLVIMVLLQWFSMIVFIIMYLIFVLVLLVSRC